jgi:hypothetical protein
MNALPECGGYTVYICAKCPAYVGNACPIWHDWAGDQCPAYITNKWCEWCNDRPVVVMMG